MFDIFLISTRHENLGKCNSNELCKIFESISPEIIFEEIPPIYFDKYYVDKSRSNLETDAINKYIQKNKIEHIPVDSDNIPSDEFFKKHKYMFERIEGLADINGFTLRSLIDTNKIKTEQFGFSYLNSKETIYIYREMYVAIKNGLDKLKSEKLFQIFKSWKEITDMRENHMLQQIYDYSKKHNYQSAIFTIGAGHRYTIIEKISEFQKVENVKLNWIF